jgi:hypothetical protein
MFDDRTQDQTADATKTVDGDADGHEVELLCDNLKLVLPGVFGVGGGQVNP